MSSCFNSNVVTLRMYPSPEGVRGVFDQGVAAGIGDAPLGGLFPPEQLWVEPGCDSDPGGAAHHFLTLHDLAGNLFDLIALQGTALGWSDLQINAFQAPLASIRDAAQAALEDTHKQDTIALPSQSVTRLSQ